MDWVEFKTDVGINIYSKKIQDSIFEPNYNLITIEQMIKNKCTPEELLSFVKTIPILNMYTIVTNYIIQNLNDDAIIDDLINYDVKFLPIIQRAICIYTTNVDLYKKYCVTQVESFILSLFYYYNGQPSDITEYILSENILNNSVHRNFLYEFFNDRNESTDRFKIILFIVENLNLKIDNFNVSTLFKFLREEYAIIIMEKIFSEKYMYDFMFTIIKNCSLPNIKTIINKYTPNINILLETINYATDYDTFLYMIDLIGISNFDQDSFIFTMFKNYDIIKWLFANGFKHEPYILPGINHDIILLIINHTENYAYIKDNTNAIIKSMFQNDEQMKLFDHIPINIFNTDLMFNLAFIHEKYKLINMLVENGFKHKNISDIIHDLTVLKRESMLEYIDKNHEVFY